MDERHTETEREEKEMQSPCGRPIAAGTLPNPQDTPKEV